jgi:hypothetical protein
MKRTINTLLFVFIANLCFSQIPNNGFENWTNMGTYFNPDSWGTMNNTTAPATIFTATKATPGNPGASYLKLTSKTVGPIVVNGVAVSGVLDSITLQPISGFPYTTRSQSFTGKWQHMIYGTSQGSMTVKLTRWNSVSGARENVATANLTLSGMVMAWASFSMNFVYQSGEYPDTCIIVLKASGANPFANDYLWVDDLAFSGVVAGISENTIQQPTVIAFPNPASSEITFTNSKPFTKGDKLFVYDVLGNVVFVKSLYESNFKINTSEYANGSYIYKLINTFGVQYSEGKFTVQH